MIEPAATAPATSRAAREARALASRRARRAVQSASEGEGEDRVPDVDRLLVDRRLRRCGTDPWLDPFADQRVVVGGTKNIHGRAE